MHACSHDANSLVFAVHKADRGDLLSDLLLLLPWALTEGRPAVRLLVAGSSDPPSSLNSLITQKLVWTSLWLIWQRHVQMILWKREEHLRVCKLMSAYWSSLKWSRGTASCSVYLVLSPFFFSFTSSTSSSHGCPSLSQVSVSFSLLYCGVFILQYSKVPLGGLRHYNKNQTSQISKTAQIHNITDYYSINKRVKLELVYQNILILSIYMASASNCHPLQVWGFEADWLMQKCTGFQSVLTPENQILPFWHSAGTAGFEAATVTIWGNCRYWIRGSEG